MSINTKQSKILIYGNIFRDYRSKALVKILLDSGYHVSLICPDFYGKKILPGLKFLYLIELLIKIYFADVIYLPPMNSRFIKSASWAAKTFNKKLIVEMYISIYDTFVKDQKILNGKKIESSSRKAQEMFKKDVLALSKSDFLIHTANYELIYWQKLLNVKIASEKVFIAPNFNVSKLVCQRKKIPDSSLNICWWGTFIPLHGLDNILQAMKILQLNQVKFTCNLFGIDNPLFYVYKQKIKQEQLENHVFLRKDLSFGDNSLPKYLVDNCDLALGIFGNTDKAYNTVPNKLIEALSMGMPTLTMQSTVLREFFTSEDLWTCKPDSESIAQSIINIIEATVYNVDWLKTRAKVLDTFNISRYQQVINQVLEKATNDHAIKVIPKSQTSVKYTTKKVAK